eukprot:COSAG01_NODE_13657_length_1552_cov_4.295251_2_plen_89_part_00
MAGGVEWFAAVRAERPCCLPLCRFDELVDTDPAARDSASCPLSQHVRRGSYMALLGEGEEEASSNFDDDSDAGELTDEDEIYRYRRGY